MNGPGGRVVIVPQGTGPVEAMWQDYVASAIPEVLRLDQHLMDRSRHAFYAGVRSFLAAMMGTLDGGTEATIFDLAFLDVVDTELFAFFKVTVTEPFRQEGAVH